MDTTLYHNPACGTSRRTLAMLRDAGIEPRVIEYLDSPPSRTTLTILTARMGLPLRALLRQKGTPYAEPGLDDENPSDDQLLDAIEAHPILPHRPIVVRDRRVRLCRPPELVLDLLPGAGITGDA